MLRIAMCDDEALQLHQLETQIKNYINLHPEWIVSYTSFQTAEELLARVRKGAFHIYLLDVVMDGTDGIEIGNEIRNVDEEAIIIYTTFSPDYAIESYNVAAFYYLLKPIEEQRLFMVLDKALKRFPLKPDGCLSVRTADGTVSVQKRAIVYIEYHSHCLSYYLEDGAVITSLSFRESFNQASESLLESVLFQKVSSSYIVNLAQVEKVTKKGFLMKSGVEVNVTRLYSNAKKNYLNYILNGEK